MKLARNLLCIAAVGASTCTTVTAATMQPGGLDATLVQSGARHFEDAFAAKDAKVIADDWLPDGTFIDESGAVHAGREAIQKVYGDYFRDHAGLQKIAVTIDHIEKSQPDVLVEYGHTTLMDEKNHPISQSRYVAIHRKTGNAWPIQQLVEYPERPIEAAVPDLNWLLGKWSSTNGDKTITLASKLSPNGKFIISEFTAPDGALTGDLMISGVNPMDGRLACWIFDTTGGVGKGQWSYDAGSWYLRSMRIEPNGKRILLTHVIRPDGANGFDWKTTNRVVDGKLLADTPTTHVTKISEAK